MEIGAQCLPSQTVGWIATFGIAVVIGATVVAVHIINAIRALKGVPVNDEPAASGLPSRFNAGIG